MPDIVLYPLRDAADIPSALARLSETPVQKAFEPATVELLGRLSRRIFAAGGIGERPDIRAFGFAIREAAVEPLRQSYVALDSGTTCLTPRGTVLHFPPVNVDTVFAYSWLWSLLSGNRNVVKLSGRRSEATTWLAKAVWAELDNTNTPERLRASNLWLACDHDSETLTSLSLAADVRMIWGGDEAVTNIRRLPIRPRTIDLAFADRESAAFIDVNAAARLTAEELEALADRFAVDICTFDQAACSSPRRVLWIGAFKDAEAVSGRFWPAVDRAMAARAFAPSAEAGVEKFLVANLIAASGIASGYTRPSARLTVLTSHVADLPNRIDCGWGFVYQSFVETIDEAVTGLNERFQTVTVFGFHGVLERLGRQLAGSGIDRIVPVGQALAFGRFWDGFDFLQALTRRTQLVAE